MSRGGLRSERSRTLTERSWPGARVWHFFMDWGMRGRVYCFGGVVSWVFGVGGDGDEE